MEIIELLVKSFLTFICWIIGFKLYYKITKSSSLIDDIYKWIKK